MRDPARLEAAIALGAEIEAQAMACGIASDEVVRRFFQARRYAGAKDRRAVTTLALDAVRHRAQDIWRLGELASWPCRVALRLELAGQDWTAHFAGTQPHGPAALSENEMAAIRQAAQAGLEAAPAAARFGFPDFLTASLEARFGERLDAEMQALGTRPALDLRANSLLSDIEKTKQSLEKQGVESKRTPFSPLGLRVAAGSAVRETDAFRNGRVEVQDEGSQLAALLTAAKPGQQVIDLCAGAGGKTLALAAMMQNSGQIYAFDIDARRMAPLHGRLQRAKARNVQAHVLDGEGEALLHILSGHADIVLIDSPCSGSGTWRRDPALPWRLTPERLQRLAETQRELLQRAAPLLRAGGRIVYVTCSILDMENERVIKHFLRNNPSFELRPYADILKTAGLSEIPATLSSDERCMQLSPGSHATDGFFVAVLGRRD